MVLVISIFSRHAHHITVVCVYIIYMNMCNDDDDDASPPIPYLLNIVMHWRWIFVGYLLSNFFPYSSSSSSPFATIAGIIVIIVVTGIPMK